MSKIQIAQRDGGIVVRILGDNHEVVLSTGSQLYAREADALNAIAVAAAAFGVNIPRPVNLYRDDAGVGIVAGDYLYPLERVDERVDVDDPRAVAIGITNAAAHVDAAYDQLVRSVAVAHDRGWSWAKIGKQLGVSRQAAWERFHRKIAEARR